MITVGAVQSNHVRQTAAAACKLGLKCEVLLEHRVSEPERSLPQFGQRSAGSNLRRQPARVPAGDGLRCCDGRRCAGGKIGRRRSVYHPGGASNPVGALGYVGCGLELLQQFSEQNLDVDHIVTATGSAGTHAGLAVGIRGGGSELPILGIGVNAPQGCAGRTRLQAGPGDRGVSSAPRASCRETTSSRTATISVPATVNRPRR